MHKNPIGDAPISEKDARMLSPLKLAYLGDAVLDLYVREHMVKNDMGKAGKLHKKAVSIVNATAQARFVQSIASTFSETEADIFRRGRNAKSGMVPKNSPVADYRLATGFEALLGYLYLCGDYARLDEILNTLKSTFF
ncbi:MAG: ribonuclease III domain-containing protein [Eubacteriales bacterium]